MSGEKSTFARCDGKLSEVLLAHQRIICRKVEAPSDGLLHLLAPKVRHVVDIAWLLFLGAKAKAAVDDTIALALAVLCCILLFRVLRSPA
jgi:hypothetical protein